MTDPATAPNVLVVDDEVQIRRFLRSGFELDGYSVNEAENGREAIRAATLRPTDLIILDLADVPPLAARRIPLTTWFRFRRAVEHKPTILLAIAQQPIAGSCSSLLLQLAVAKRRQNAAHGRSRGSDLAQQRAPEEGKINCEGDCESIEPAHMHLLSGLEMHVELVRSRLDRKPARGVTFETKTAWAG